MIKLGLATINFALDELFNTKVDLDTQEPYFFNSVAFFFAPDSHYQLWLKTLGIKEWQHPFFMLTKFQIKHKKIRSALE